MSRSLTLVNSWNIFKTHNWRMLVKGAGIPSCLNWTHNHKYVKVEPLR